MRYFYILLAIIFICCISCTRKSKEISQEQTTIEIQEEIEDGHVEEYTLPTIHEAQSIKLAKSRDFFSSNRNLLNQTKIDKVTSTLDQIIPLTAKLINLPDSQDANSKQQLNMLVQKYGYKDLDDFGKNLNDVAWAAVTYTKWEKLKKQYSANPNSKAVKYFEENLIRRLKKQAISKGDLTLIRKNWNTIDSALSKLDDITNARLELDNKKYR
jgi:hypothetical protein